MASHRSPMIIYIKHCGSRVSPVLPAYIPKNPKSDVKLDPRNQMRFWYTKLFRFQHLYVNHYNGIRQKPHDHLYQKLWQQGLADFTRIYPKKP